MQIQLYLQMLRNSWWVVALTSLAALILTLLLALAATPQYEAQARFLVGPAASFSSNPNQSIYPNESLNRRSTIQTFSEVVNTSYMFAEAGTALRMTPEELAEYEHSTVSTPEANVLILTVAGPDPRRAAELANTLGRRAVSLLQGLYPAYEINVISPAITSNTPVSPQPMRDVSIAVFLGLALGAILAIGREYLYIPAEMLRQRTAIDGVSQAFNRRAFEHYLEQELIRNQTGPLSLGILRLDGLEDYMDDLPQPTTQKVLRQVTQTLRNELRGKDTIGRWSETSYAVLLPGTPGLTATRTLERIQEMLAEPMELASGGETLSLNPYVGVVACQSDKTARMLLERAEQAAERARDTDEQTVFVSADLKALSG